MAEKTDDKAREREKPEASAGAAGEGEAGKPKKGKAWLALALVPVAGAVAGIVATLAIPRHEPTKAPKGPSSDREVFEYFAISEVKSNLARSGGMHFCLLDLQVHVRTREDRIDAVRKRFGGKAGDAARGEVAALQGALGTLARDRLILLLASKGMEELEGREKKDQLKSEIVRELNPILFPEKDGEIVAVYFKDLLIQ
jgi:flagellar basal body-associated protein FliL